MALVLNTNVGFVDVAPTADPAGSNTTIDGSSVVVKDTSPVGATKITGIGWYRGAGTNSINFEVALYADSAGAAGYGSGVSAPLPTLLDPARSAEVGTKSGTTMASR